MGRYRMLSRTNRRAEGALLRTTRATVEPLLRRLEALGEQAFHCVGRSADAHREVLPCARRHPLQHEVGGILPAGWAPDPDADAVEVLAPERLRERADPVVAGAPPAELDHQ